VDVNLSAFFAPEMTIAMGASGSITNSVESREQHNVILSKRTQEGLDQVIKNKSTGTATISYKSGSGSHVFLIKAGQVFGSVRYSKDSVYGLEPCFSPSPDLLKQTGFKKENCHLWFKRNSELEKNKTSNPDMMSKVDKTFFRKETPSSLNQTRTN